MKINKKISLLICVFWASFLDAEILRRAALDVGSEIRITVADVDTETNQIVHTFYQATKLVGLRNDLAASSDNCLSQKAQEKFIDTLKELKTEMTKFAPQQWFGVGTSVFRKAKNGQEVLDRVKALTDVTILLIEQKEEGEIGFLSAVTTSKMNPESVNIWDSGSGSFQISTLIDGSMETYGAELGFVPLLETLFAVRKKSFLQNLSPNPISSSEVNQLSKIINKKLPSTPKWASEKQIIGIGGKTSIFATASIALGQTTFTKDQVWETLLSLCGKSDKDLEIFPEPSKTVLGLILLHSVMDHCYIDSLSFFPTNGSCEGILITPHYWDNN